MKATLNTKSQDDVIAEIMVLMVRHNISLEVLSGRIGVTLKAMVERPELRRTSREREMASMFGAIGDEGEATK